MFQKVVPFLAALALVLPAAGQAQARIGFINSITGSEAPIGENLTNGVTLALEDLQKQGIKVNLVKQDDTGKPQVAVTAMEQLATGDEVAVVVGPYTSNSANAVAQQAEQYEVPEIIPAAAKEDLTRQNRRWVFRLNSPARVYAQQLIDAALAFGKPKTIAFIYESTDFGNSVSAVGKEYAQRKGLKIVGDEAYQKGAPDFRSTLGKIKSQNPDLVFMVSYVADAISLMRQSREVGLKPQAFLGGGAGFDTAQFEGETDISTNVYSVTQWTPDIGYPGAAEFAKRYQERFGKKPTYHAACAYAAMVIAGETSQKAGGDRNKIREALVSGTWNTIVGPVDFADFDGFQNQNQIVMPVIQYQGGKAVTVYPAKMAKAKPVYPFPGWKSGGK